MLTNVPETPCYVRLVPKNLLAPLQPKRHLWIFILAVCGTICLFGEVDVQSLCVLSVVVVCRPEELDGVEVVVE